MLGKLSQRVKKYQNYVKKLHNSFSTPPRMLYRYLRSTLGIITPEMERVAAGESQEVYEIQKNPQKKFVIKISRKEEKQLERIVWVSKHLRQLHLPVPRILYMKTVFVRNRSLVFYLEKKIQGQSLLLFLSQQKKVNRRKLNSLMYGFGRMLKKIHSVKTSGFDLIDGRGKGQFKTWNDFMLDPLQRRKEFQIMAKKIHIKERYVNLALSLLLKYQEVYKNVEPRLLYGDLSPKNLLVYDFKITGLIDFEDAMSGDPVFDFARWSFFGYFHQIPLKLIYPGYDQRVLSQKNFALKKKLYRVRFSIDFLNYMVIKGNLTGLEYAKKKFMKDVEILNKR